jgi:hypothetical protein
MFPALLSFLFSSDQALLTVGVSKGGSPTVPPFFDRPGPALYAGGFSASIPPILRSVKKVGALHPGLSPSSSRNRRHLSQ